MEKIEKDKKMSSETLEELLTKTRRDLEEQIKVDSKLSQELVRLRQKNEALLVSLSFFFSCSFINQLRLGFSFERFFFLFFFPP